MSSIAKADTSTLELNYRVSRRDDESDRCNVFKSPKQAQRFLSTRSRIHNHSQLRRHRITADEYRAVRDAAFRT